MKTSAVDIQKYIRLILLNKGFFFFPSSFHFNTMDMGLGFCKYFSILVLTRLIFWNEPPDHSCFWALVHLTQWPQSMWIRYVWVEIQLKLVLHLLRGIRSVQPGLDIFWNPCTPKHKYNMHQNIMQRLQPINFHIELHYLLLQKTSNITFCW